MTTELFWLLLTMLLAASLWIPFIIGVTTTESAQHVTADGRAMYTDMLPWVQRANRAHLNLLEQSMPFAALVIMAHALGVSSMFTIAAAIAFFWLRVAHAVIMLRIENQIPVRPIVFTAAWICSLIYVVEILRLG